MVMVVTDVTLSMIPPYQIPPYMKTCLLTTVGDGQHKAVLGGMHHHAGAWGGNVRLFLGRKGKQLEFKRSPVTYLLSQDS